MYKLIAGKPKERTRCDIFPIGRPTSYLGFCCHAKTSETLLGTSERFTIFSNECREDFRNFKLNINC